MLCVIGTLGGFAGGARGATLEGLLMPGPLHSEHAKQESDCTTCHDRANRARQATLCSACHKDVATDIRDKRGLHGKRPEIAQVQCNACHSEHLGRDGRITPRRGGGVRPFADGLPHRWRRTAMWPAPAATRQARSIARRPAAASDCHKKAEPHQGKLGTDCAACHETVALVRGALRPWQDALRAAGSAMRRSPAPPATSGNRWKETPMACASCHTPDDVHRGSRGTACADCHTQASWKDAKFDHEKVTGFALLGAHRTASCQSCHRTGRFEDEIPKDCSGCHAAIDSHAGRMGTKCESCHEASAWKDTHFVHERDAKFTLRGAHSKLACHSCHVARVTRSQACTGLRCLPSRGRCPRRLAGHAVRELPRPRCMEEGHPLRPRRHGLPAAGPARGGALRAAATRRRSSRMRPRTAPTATRRTTCTRATWARTARAATAPMPGRCGSSTTRRKAASR